MIAAVLQVVRSALFTTLKSPCEGLSINNDRISLYDRHALNSGVFDIGSVVYLLSVTVFFLFISVQSLETRRWS